MTVDPSDLEHRRVVLVTVGYLSAAVLNLFPSMTDVAWYDKTYLHGALLLYCAAAMLGVVSILAYYNRQTLDSIVFFGAAAMAWSFQKAADAASPTAAGITVSLPVGQPQSYQGWYFGVFFAWAAILWLSSFKADRLRQSYLLVLTFTHLAATIGCWFSLAILQPVAGWLGLVSTAIAVAIAATAVISFGRNASSHPLPSNR